MRCLLCFVCVVALLGGAPAYTCTLFGITGSQAADGSVFIGSTMDNAWWPTRHTLWVYEPDDGYKILGSKAGPWGLGSGINEKGLAFSYAFVGVTDEPDPEGVDRYQLGPMLLKYCANVPEAIELLKTLPRSAAFPAGNRILADADGNIALVEVSFQSIHVETLTSDGYIVRSNHFTSEEMKDLDRRPDDFICPRLEAGLEWIEVNRAHTTIHIEDMFTWLGYAYLHRLLDPVSGPGTCAVFEPRALTYWFTYGWPSGNIPPLDLQDRQLNQDMTWGVFIPFYLPNMPPGQYTTELGQLTPLAIQYLYSHFSSELQRSPAWMRYQSVDPERPFYKPAELVASPCPYERRENPYCPRGMPGTWSRDEGFVPYED